MIRTRFAPSPTGELHIGGARTALFNCLFARSAGKGAFILRIDDTDVERSKSVYERQLMEDLRWLGLEWDEGPDMGLSVPYRQSERRVFYEEWLENLKKEGVVYPCFCSEERLEAARKEQLSRGEPPRYGGVCRRLPSGEVNSRLSAGEKPCWRFALPDSPIVFHDAVRGELRFAPDTMGDFVVERSDGGATYLFTSVVDDRLMEITHIIRGDEHVPNTARQQAIFDRLGWNAPVYAHIPMILSEDRQKLSKRTGSTPIRVYREQGYLPEALDAYLSTLSWTPPSGGASLLSLRELAAVFSLDRISTSTPVHDETHLKYWQKEAMRSLGGKAILKKLTDLDSRFKPFDPTALSALIDDLLEENPTLPLLLEALEVLHERPSLRGETWLPELRQMLRTVEPWEEAELNKRMREFMKERGLKGKEFFHPLRLGLTGREKGAALTLLMWTLGRDEVSRRI